MRFEILGTVVSLQIRAKTIDGNGGGEGAEEEQRRREEVDTKMKGEPDIWRFHVQDARETIGDS